MLCPITKITSLCCTDLLRYVQLTWGTWQFSGAECLVEKSLKRFARDPVFIPPGTAKCQVLVWKCERGVRLEGKRILFIDIFIYVVFWTLSVSRSV
jgi:hypothetical protein